MAVEAGSMPMRHQASICDQLFEDHRKQVQELQGRLEDHGQIPIVPAHLIADYQQRFNAWANYLGVFVHGRASLDRRLERHRATGIDALFLQVLFLLEKKLRGAIDALPENITSLESYPAAIWQKNSIMPAYAVIERCLDRLLRVGATLPQFFAASVVPRDTPLAEKRGQTRRERLALLAVKALYTGATEGLQVKLSKTIIARCDRIENAKKQRGKQVDKRRPRVVIPELEVKCFAGVQDEQTMTLPGTEHKGVGPSDRDVKDEPAIPNDDGISRIDTRPSDSDPPTLREGQRRDIPEDYCDQHKDGARSTTGITASGQASEADYPETPKLEILADGIISELVTCQWCLTPFPATHFSKTCRWRKHVDEDLKPYACLAEACEEMESSFVSFDDWRNHMEDLHGEMWAEELYRPPATAWICDTDHPDAITFPDSSSLLEHMRGAHANTFTDLQIERIVETSAIRKRLPEWECPLCRFDIRKLVGNPPKQGGIKSTLLQLGLPLTPSLKKGESSPPLSSQKPGSKTQPDLAFGVSHNGSGEERNPVDTSGRHSSRHNSRELTASMAKHIGAHLLALAFFSVRLLSLCLDLEDEAPASEVKSLGGSCRSDVSTSGAGSHRSKADSSFNRIPLKFSDAPGDAQKKPSWAGGHGRGSDSPSMPSSNSSTGAYSKPRPHLTEHEVVQCKKPLGSCLGDQLWDRLQKDPRPISERMRIMGQHLDNLDRILDGQQR